MTDPANGDEQDGDEGRTPPSTVIDPGRAPTVPPSTTLDPGRGSAGPPESAALTIVDAGRAAADSRPPSPTGLPAALADRFNVVREMAKGGQADLYLVTEKATGAQRALKVYAAGYRPDEQVWTYLRIPRTTPSVVAMFEADVADGRCYEVMEFLAGDDLATLRAKPTFAELGEQAIDTIIGQVVDGLAELHANGIVHRDLKPSNIRLRSLDPVQAVIVDLGISSFVGDGKASDDRSCTPRYATPEFLSAGWIAPTTDWWALGISLIEFFTGNEVMAGLDDVSIKRRIVSGPIKTSGVADLRQRMLCQGLTAQTERERWGADTVRRWRAGESPPVPQDRAPDPERAGAAKEPFRYNGVDYRFPDELAAAMTDKWELSAAWLHGDDGEPRKQLRAWAEQFPDLILPRNNRLLNIVTGATASPRDVRLLRTLRALDPSAPPVYRNVNITVARLPELGQAAFRVDGNSPAIVEELWSHKDLLPLLATGRLVQTLGGGDGLVEVQMRWRAERERLSAQGRSLPDRARTELGRLEREEPTRLLGIALLAATANAEQREVAVRTVERCAVEVRAAAAEVRAAEVREATVDVGWFDELAARPDVLWLAFALVPFAVKSRDELLAAAVDEQAKREWLRRTQALREWSRRQNRPQALAWAAAAVAALTAVAILLIAVSDMVGVVSDASITDAWLATVASLLVVLIVEALLAWQIGGDVHPRYSIIGAGVIALGRGARTVTGRGIALPVLLGVLGGPVLVAVFAPVLVPLAGATLVVGWAWLRYLRWQADCARDQERIEQAERERQAAPA